MVKGSRLARYEFLVLGVLALLVAGAYVFPWSVVKDILASGKPKEYAFANIRQNLNRDMQGSPHWRAPTNYVAETRYSPESGALRITLSNKHDSRVAGLSLRAEFSQAGGTGPSRSAWLRHEAGGNYSLDGMKLPKGNWVMSLTASEPKGPLFRLEQVVKVD